MGVENEFPVKVRIRNSQGSIRVMDATGWIDDATGAFDDYMWSEGNYSCDCNRGLFWDRCAGEERDGGDYPCSEGQFAVRITDTDGKVLYDEFAAVPREGG